jgi:hypothetical protein
MAPQGNGALGGQSKSHSRMAASCEAVSAVGHCQTSSRTTTCDIGLEPNYGTFHVATSLEMDDTLSPHKVMINRSIVQSLSISIGQVVDLYVVDPIVFELQHPYITPNIPRLHSFACPPLNDPKDVSIPAIQPARARLAYPTNKSSVGSSSGGHVRRLSSHGTCSQRPHQQ